MSNVTLIVNLKDVTPGDCIRRNRYYAEVSPDGPEICVGQRMWIRRDPIASGGRVEITSTGEV